MARGKRPDPFRTRKLSLPAPMVLPRRRGGRVGRRRTTIPEGAPAPLGPLRRLHGATATKNVPTQPTRAVGCCQRPPIPARTRALGGGDPPAVHEVTARWRTQRSAVHRSVSDAFRRARRGSWGDVIQGGTQIGGRRETPTAGPLCREPATGRTIRARRA